MIRAVLYLRSSKDRSDVSIDAQRRELSELAQSRGMAVVGSYVDAVESGKDDQRPGFQELIKALRDRDRGWDHILALDTSRIARRRAVAILFEEHECRKQGVRVVYKSLPDSDPITEMLLKSVLQAMDEWHSLTSKAKGLSGMAENVRKGFRAGGKAPRGYRLQHEPTGAVRDGMPVLKSKLVPADDAPVVRAYLQHRSKGLPRARAMQLAGVDWPVTTALSVERNARTYAGHTIWNVHAERDENGYIGGEKFRPESEWIKQEGTHAALITDAEADAILAQLEAKKGRRTKAGKRVYLLTGLLEAPDGASWQGDSGYYRLGKGRRILAETVELALVQRVMADLAGDELAQAIADHYRKLAEAAGKSKSQAPAIRRKIAELDRRATTLADLLGQTTAPAALLRQIETLEAERDALLIRLDEAEHETALNSAMKKLTAGDIKRILSAIAEDMNQHDPAGMRDTLAQIVEKIEMDPETMLGSVYYRTGIATGDKLASPRGTELIPGSILSAAPVVVVPHRRVRRG